MNRLLRCVFLLCLFVGCAPLPDDPYEREMALLDRQSALCGLSGSGAGQISCEARVASKRQQYTAEEMNRRDREAVREQTEGIREAITAVGTASAPAATPVAPTTVTQWCAVVVDGGKALESCHFERADCNRLWGDLTAAGKKVTDCSQRTLVVTPVPVEQPVAPTKWCTSVTISGATTESCYPNADECLSALKYHRQAEIPATDCTGKP